MACSLTMSTPTLKQPGRHQRMVAAYREPDRKRGREMMMQLIDSASDPLYARMIEVAKLGGTLKRRADAIRLYEGAGFCLHHRSGTTRYYTLGITEL